MCKRRTIASMLVALVCVVAASRSLPGCSANPADDLPTDTPDAAQVTSIHGQVEPRVLGVGVIGVRNGVSSAVDITDDDGVYALQDIPAGEYNLIASGAGFFTDTSARGVIARRGEQTLAPLITMRPLTAAATLRGQAVSDATGEAPAGVQVTVECRAGVCSNITATTDAGGMFEVSIWPDLHSRVVFQKAGYAPAFVNVDPVPSAQTHTAPPARLTKADA